MANIYTQSYLFKYLYIHTHYTYTHICNVYNTQSIIINKEREKEIKFLRILFKVKFLILSFKYALPDKQRQRRKIKRVFHLIFYFLFCIFHFLYFYAIRQMTPLAVLLSHSIRKHYGLLLSFCCSCSVMALSSLSVIFMFEYQMNSVQ